MVNEIRTVTDQLLELDDLETEVEEYSGHCKTQLIGEFRQSARRWAIPRAIIKFISGGRLCRLSPFAHNAEIVDELKTTIWWKEIDKLEALYLEQISILRNSLRAAPPDHKAFSEADQMMNIIRCVITE